MLAAPVDARRSECVDRPEPNSNAVLSGGSSAATFSRNSQLRGGSIQAGISALGSAVALNSATRRCNWSSRLALAEAGLDSAITFQNSFHHFDPHRQSRLVFEQSNQREPGQFEQVPNE